MKTAMVLSQALTLQLIMNKMNMLKNKYIKYLTLCLSLFIVGCLSGCGSDGGNSSSQNNEVQFNDDNVEQGGIDVIDNTPTNDDSNTGGGDNSLSELTPVGMEITSKALKHTGSDVFHLPLNYTCDGAVGGISPLLSWNGLPEGTSHVALTMHSDSENEPNKYSFSIFNIPASTSSLLEGDFSVGTALIGDPSSQAYLPPCPTGSGETALYTITLYALTSAINLDETVTQENLVEALSSVLIQSTSLSTQYTRFDEAAINNNDHVPISGVTSCEEKTVHFNQYSVVHKSVTCDESTNQLSVVSHISEGLKTQLPDQQVQVGIEHWIGRLPLVSQTGSDIRVTPSFYNQVNNNLGCDGTEFLGVTVDGQLILPFFKQNNDSGNGASCGPTDGDNYADRDTVVLGEVDQCYGHSPNGEGYHLHGAPVCLMDVHDPSKPIAYMADGIPLYFGKAGGTITHTEHAKTAKTVTDLNYGGGLYEHLDYRPSDVKDGSNPLNECNAYDINGDGDISGYVYYSSQEAPYTIGCFMGETLANPKKVDVTRTQLSQERAGWSGQMMGEAIDVTIVSSQYGLFNQKKYNITEMLVNKSTSYLTVGDYAQVLWRVVDENDDGYEINKTCFEFRYRADKNNDNNDETEVICSKNQVPTTTLDFTPFSDGENDNNATTSNQSSFKLEAWADNWFAAYQGDALIVEDSIAITTEKSFNAETANFTGDYPMTLSFIIKDFKENDTGLEYIYTDKQQMGDGGFIAQITDLNTGSIVAVTNENWACTVVHQAPLDKSCADEGNPVAGQGACQYSTIGIPSQWKADNFDDSAWQSTTEYTENEVGVKDGYDEITWHDNAKLIWGADLEMDNTLLCRVTISK